MTAVAKLPELPEMSTLARMNVAGSDDVILVLGYTAEQMDAYVRAALSARASAGEGGEKRFIYTYRCMACRFEADMCDSAKIALVKCPCGGTMQRKDNDPIASFTAAPQPAQAGASGGGGRIKTKGPDDFASHVCPAESSAVWNACVYEHERIAEGLPPILSSTEVTPASPATGQVAAGCAHVWVPGQAGMMYCDQCGRQKPAATPQPAAVQEPQWVGWLRNDVEDDDALAAAPQPQYPAKFDRNGSETTDAADMLIPPAHGDGEGAFASVAASKPCPACGSYGPCDDFQRCMNTAITTNFRGETFAEARQQLVNVLKAQKSWMTGYAESYVDEFADMAATRPTPEAQEARDAKRYRHMRDRNNSLERFQRDKDNGASCYHVVGGVRELKSGDELDAAIDAALALPAQGEGNNG